MTTSNNELNKIKVTIGDFNGEITTNSPATRVFWPPESVLISFVNSNQVKTDQVRVTCLDEKFDSKGFEELLVSIINDYIEQLTIEETDYRTMLQEIDKSGIISDIIESEIIVE